jgi:hypothetical protein
VIVAWPPSNAGTTSGGTAVQAVAISYLVKGLLTEAAALTGTARREQVTVVVYPSEDTLRTLTHAPAWADGIYNGAFVAVSAKPSAELGVDISTLRHELMHAQLHVAVGCMPAWFNEGVAMYYQGVPPVRTWLRLLRGPDSVDMDSFRTPSYVLLPGERAEVAYGESLAMIVYLVEHAGDIGIKNAIQSLRAANRETPRGGLDLWNRLYPGIGHRAVLDTLAHKMFGVARATDLDGVLQGAVCCRSMRSLNDLGCRGMAPRGDRRYWLDEASHAFCMSRW